MMQKQPIVIILEITSVETLSCCVTGWTVSRALTPCPFVLYSDFIVRGFPKSLNTESCSKNKRFSRHLFGAQIPYFLNRKPLPLSANYF